MVKYYLNNSDITAMVNGSVISGSASEAGRCCDVSYINAPYDPNLKSLPDISLGDYITVTDDDDGELFFGRVTSREKSSAYGTITANCIDDAQLLLKSNVRYSYVGKTAEEICALILADLEFPAGSFVATGVEIESYVADDISAYDAIKQAYDTAAETTGAKYWIEMYNRSLRVIEYGSQSTGFTISDQTNITDSSYTESADSIVNRVVIYDSEGNRIGQVDDSDAQSLYGMYQQLYTEEDGVDPETAAANMLEGPEQSLSVSVLGDNSCISGRSVVLHDSATGLYGLYWISNDKHTYQDGQHTMELELSFKELTQGD